MDEKRSILFLIKRHWRAFVIVFCICFGVGLIYSSNHLFPVFLDSMTVRMPDEEEIYQPTHPPFSIPPPESSDSDFIVYLPIISSNKAEEEQLVAEVPPFQEGQNDFVEDHGLELNIYDGNHPVTILLDPTIKQNHAITPVEVTFLPGEQCNFGDGHACVYEFSSSAGNRITFVSVHSGYGGEGDELRNLFEGTGINQGLFEPVHVLSIAQSLSGTAVEIAQGDTKIKGLTLTSVTRIPPEHFIAYTALPVERGLDYAVQNSLLDSALLNQDLMIIETCGWRLPGETQIEGLKVTSSSVYLVVIPLENFEYVKK